MTYDDIMTQIQSLLPQGMGGTGNAAQAMAAPSTNQWSPGGTGNGLGSGNTFNLAKQSEGATGLGMNIGTGQMALSGLATLGSLFAANKGQKLAEDQFKFQKGMANTNLNNQIQSYNTTLTDRLTSRGVAQGQDAATVQAEIDKNRLAR